MILSPEKALRWHGRQAAQLQVSFCIELRYFYLFFSASQTSGVVTSVGYPNPYPNNLNRTYPISVPSGQTIELTFRKFSVEVGTKQLMVQVLANSPMHTASCDIKMSVIYLLPLKYVKKMWQCSSERQSQALFVRCSFR